MNPTGSEVTVYDHGTQACQPDDIPDIGARAIKDSLGRTQLIVSHYNTRREIGTTLDNVTHNCNVVFFSDSDPDPGDYNYQEWIHSIYTPTAKRLRLRTQRVPRLGLLRGMRRADRDSRHRSAGTTA